MPDGDTVTLSFQIIQEVEKQRIEVLCNILNKYNLHMASFRHTLVHVSVLPKWLLITTLWQKLYHSFLLYYLQRQKQIEQAIQKVDVEKDIQNLVETGVTAEENKAKFLMTDYFVRVHFVHIINRTVHLYL